MKGWISLLMSVRQAAEDGLKSVRSERAMKIRRAADERYKKLLTDVCYVHVQRATDELEVYTRLHRRKVGKSKVVDGNVRRGLVFARGISGALTKAQCYMYICTIHT